MDFATLLRILPLAMHFIQSASDPTTDAGMLAQEIRNLLSQHKTQLSQAAAMYPQMTGGYGATPPSLDHIKTPKDLLHFIKTRPTTGEDDFDLLGSA